VAGRVWSLPWPICILILLGPCLPAECDTEAASTSMASLTSAAKCSAFVRGGQVRRDAARPAARRTLRSALLTATLACGHGTQCEADDSQFAAGRDP